MRESDLPRGDKRLGMTGRTTFWLAVSTGASYPGFPESEVRVVSVVIHNAARVDRGQFEYKIPDRRQTRAQALVTRENTV